MHSCSCPELGWHLGSSHDAPSFLHDGAVHALHPAVGLRTVGSGGLLQHTPGSQLLTELLVEELTAPVRADEVDLVQSTGVCAHDVQQMQQGGASSILGADGQQPGVGGGLISGQQVVTSTTSRLHWHGATQVDMNPVERDGGGGGGGGTPGVPGLPAHHAGGADLAS